MFSIYDQLSHFEMTLISLFGKISINYNCRSKSVSVRCERLLSFYATPYLILFPIFCDKKITVKNNFMFGPESCCPFIMIRLIFIGLWSSFSCVWDDHFGCFLAITVRFQDSWSSVMHHPQPSTNAKPFSFDAKSDRDHNSRLVIERCRVV